MAAQYGYAQLMQAQGTRKNATRESTQQLKAWLKEHQKNPYPTKGEKIMLALVSGMSLTQVSTWFANARRRLKKENKWCPEGGSEDNDEFQLDAADVLMDWGNGLGVVIILVFDLELRRIRGNDDMLKLYSILHVAISV